MLASVDEIRELLELEVLERFEEGFNVDVKLLKEQIRAARNVEELNEIYERLQGAELREDYPYREPNDWREIIAERPSTPTSFHVDLDERSLLDKLLGAWLGRCSGCMLGKPVEGWSRERITKALERIGENPLKGPYIPLAAFSDLAPEHRKWVYPLTREGIRRAERDDDLDYTLLNLALYELKGPGFTTSDVASAWLTMLPYHLTYTAERAAYRNLVLGLKPPETAVYLNPYREWIGAQIRADLWGYVSPGNPERASMLAYKDARLSHVKNGIYGEMFFAAALALAYKLDEPVSLINEALKVIPKNCRLAEAVSYVVSLYGEGIDWGEAIEDISARYGAYHPVHTINNAAIVAAALIWSEGDFVKAISYAVTAGLDTDCNGATTGSIMGLMLGASNLPQDWVKPLNDRLATALSGLGELSIRELAERTLKCLLLYPE